MSAGQLLRVRGVSKSFAGVHALHEVDFAVDAGEVVCLAGENGSGKSTLVKVLAEVVAPDSGTIEVDGRERSSWAPIDAVRAGFEVIYQDFSLFPNLTVAENIAFNSQLSEGRRLVSWRTVRRAAEQGLEMVGVSVPIEALIEDLSVADKQVVAIARALVQGARLIAMDEPTTALTGREVQSLLNIVRRLKRDGVAVVFISHKLGEIFAVCERIVVLRNGVKVADGQAASFDMASLSQHMLGRQLEQHSGARRGPTRRRASEARGIRSRRPVSRRVPGSPSGGSARRDRASRLRPHRSRQGAVRARASRDRASVRRGPPGQRSPRLSTR